MTDLELIKRLCDNKNLSNLKFLDKLSNETRDLLIFWASVSIKLLTITPNVKLAKSILNYFDVISPKFKKESKITEKKAENIISDNLSIELTGARIGDMLVGIGNTSKNAVIKIHNHDIAPRTRTLNILRTYPDIWRMFLDKLSSIPFFSKMSILDREIYLTSTENDQEAMAEDKSKIEFLQLGGDYTKKLSEEESSQLLEGLWSAQDLYNIWPRKAGSKAKRPTMSLYKYAWKIKNEYNINNNFKGLILDISETDNYTIYILDDITKKMKKINDEWIRPSGAVQQIGIKVDNGKNEYIYDTDDENIKKFSNILSKFTAGGLKSLLQKLIRFQPLFVSFNNITISAENALLITMIELIKNPGSLVPDIKRFVSGLESFCKRLGIISCEDASILKNDINTLYKLFVSALLIQRIKKWDINTKLIKEFLNFGIKLLNTDEYIDYSFKDDVRYIISGNKITDISAILDELKSFSGDLSLIRDTMYKIENDNIKYKKRKSPRPDIMPIEHCLDQHWSTGIGYYFSYTFINKIRKELEDDTKPFGKLFSLLFKNVSGLNPRKHKLSKYVDTEFFKEVRKAQKEYMNVLINNEERDEEGKIINFNYTLPYEYIFGMIGTIEIKYNKQTLLVTVDAKDEDNEKFTAIKRPSRDIEDASLDPETSDIAINKTKKVLESGVNNVIKSYNPFNDKKIYRKNGNYFIGKIPWNEARNLNIELIENIDILPNAFDQLLSLSFSSQLILKRLLMILSTFQNEIEMNRISRDGGSVKHSVSLDDIDVFHILRKISKLFPAALKLISPIKFKIKIPPLLWKIREILREKVEMVKVEYKWSNIYDKKERIPWEHQKESISEMIKNRNNPGHFIFMGVGLGKTYIVLSYLSKIVSITSIKYIIYTLPKSAIKSVSNEIESFNLTINHIIPLKNGNKEFKFGVVNLIEHDHLRRVENELISIAGESIFIIDETHKCLNDTKRTTVALEVSRLSKQFIALTGTPVIDSKIYKLIWWLGQLVPYELNEYNFFVSVNAMVSRQVNTGVIASREEINVPLKDLEIKYRNLVPIGIGGNNKNPSNIDIKNAVEMCYDVVSIKMIDDCYDIVKNGNGVMLVAKNQKHLKQLNDMLIDKGIKKKDIFLLEKDNSIYLTDEEVENNNVDDYKVVITTINKVEGYTLTRFHYMLTSVYPSNNASREQLEGRINRIGQRSKYVYYRIYHTGILTYILYNHNNAKNLSVALKGLVNE